MLVALSALTADEMPSSPSDSWANKPANANIANAGMATANRTIPSFARDESGNSRQVGHRTVDEKTGAYPC